MIDPLTIGAGLTIFALGAGGTWAVMRAKEALFKAALMDAETERQSWISMTCTAASASIRNHNDLSNERAAHSRCADASATKQRILDDLADYLRGQKSGTAVKALRMIEERHL